MAMVLDRRPITSTSRTPIYSNMAFQLLAYAVENITGQSFANLVHEYLLKPLNLERTLLDNPVNDTNAVVVDGWDLVLGDEAP